MDAADIQQHGRVAFSVCRIVRKQIDTHPYLAAGHSRDVEQLIGRIRKAVAEKFAVELELEINVW